MPPIFVSVAAALSPTEIKSKCRCLGVLLLMQWVAIGMFRLPYRSYSSVSVILTSPFCTFASTGFQFPVYLALMAQFFQATNVGMKIIIRCVGKLESDPTTRRRLSALVSLPTACFTKASQRDSPSSPWRNH